MKHTDEITPPEREQPSWLAVFTAPGKEGLVTDKLTNLGFEMLYLHYPAVARHARGEKTVKRSYFSRYVFAGIQDGQSVYDINTCQGVSTVVYMGDKPLEIPLAVIEELRTRAYPDGRLKVTPEETSEERRRFRQGQKVQITEGILQGLDAIIDVDKGHSIDVWLGLFRGKVRADLPPEALSPARRRFALGRL